MKYYNNVHLNIFLLILNMSIIKYITYVFLSQTKFYSIIYFKIPFTFNQSWKLIILLFVTQIGIVDTGYKTTTI